MNTLLRSRVLGSQLAVCRCGPVASHHFAKLPRATCELVKYAGSRSKSDHLERHPNREEPTSEAAANIQNKYANTVRAKFDHITDALQRKLAYAELRLGPLSGPAAELQSALDTDTADPFETLKSHLDDNESPSVDIIRVCVIAAKNRIFRLPRAERAMALSSKNYGIARQTLLRIMEKHDLWVRFMLHDAEACSSLCYFAIKEGIDPVIVDWIKMEEIDEDLLQVLRHETNNRTGIFRNLLLKGLMAGYTMQETHSADRALRCLKEIMAWKIQRIKDAGRGHVQCRYKHEPRTVWETDDSAGNPGTLSVLPAIMVLRVQLCRTGWHETDPALYNWFISCSSKLKNEDDDPWGHRGSLRGKLDQASLNLYHPVSPDASEFLDLIQEIRKPMSGESRIEIPNPNVGKALLAGFPRAYAVSKAHQRHEDATWLEPIYRNTFGKKLKVGDIWDRRMPPNWKPPTSSTPQSDIADGHPTVWRAIKT